MGLLFVSDYLSVVKAIANFFFQIIAELPESAYKLDTNEIKQLYQSSVERRQNLENR